MFPSSAWLSSTNREPHPEWEAAVYDHPKPRRNIRKSSLSMGLPLPRVAEESPEKPMPRKTSFNPAATPFNPIAESRKISGSSNVSGSTISQAGSSSIYSEHVDRDIDEHGIARHMAFCHHELERQSRPSAQNPWAYTLGSELTTPYGNLVKPVAIPHRVYASTHEVPVHEAPKKKNIGVIGGERAKARGNTKKNGDAERGL